MHTVLLIDDNEDYRSTASAILTDEGYDVFEVRCPDEAYALLARERCDLIISDIHLPFTLGDNFYDYPYSCEVGVKTVQELRSVFPDMPIIAVSAAADMTKLREILRGFPVLEKPTSPSTLVEVVRRALEIQSAIQ